MNWGGAAQSWLRLLLAAPFGATILLTLAGFLGGWWWALDLASHFRWQYFLILVGGALFFAIRRFPVEAGLCLFFALVNLGLLLPAFLPPRSPVAQPGGRILLANVLQDNQSYEQARRLIAASQADYVALVEVNAAWLKELEALRETYPYWHTAVREDNYGLALLSRRPLQAAEVRHFGPAGIPTLTAEVEQEGRSLTLVVTHPPPPRGEASSAFRNAQLEVLARFAAETPGPLALCGDLNLTPWSPYFGRLLERSGLHDSTLGFGLQPTWPAGSPLLRIPIDHCLVSREIHVLQRQVQPAIGSDHLPVLLDFALRPE